MLTATTFIDILPIVVSMQDQQRTNALSVEWHSCRTVTLRDGVLHCLLETEKPYDLAEAYEDNLHVRFANADSDKELMDFIRAWGPLWIPDAILIPNGQIPPGGVVDLPLARCREYQRQMKALIGALTAFKWGEREREALEELIQTESAVSGDSPYTVADFLGIRGDALEWAKGASIADVRAATNRLVDSNATPAFALKLSLWRSRSERMVQAGWSFMNLQDALRWMVWYDEFTQHPVICCPECRRVFRGETKRVRKYCSTECGHRATARVSMRKKRAAERTGRE